MINQLKSSLFKNKRVLQKHKVIIHRQEIIQYWDQMSLIEKQKLLFIIDTVVIQHVYRHVLQYLTVKKFTDQYPAYSIQYKKQYYLTVYDCLVLRVVASEEKQMRQLLTSFLIIIKHVDDKIVNKVHEVIDNDILKQTMIKIKASYILRVINFLQKYVKDYFQGQKIILKQQMYGQFITLWINRTMYTDIRQLIKNLFVGILALLENQIIRAFCQTVNPNQLKQRKYQQPVRILQKPKQKQSSTMIQSLNNRLSSVIKQDLLKIQLFKVKYTIKQSKDNFYCYHNLDDQDNSEDQQQRSFALDSEDRLISESFKLFKWWTTEYYYNVYGLK